MVIPSDLQLTNGTRAAISARDEVLDQRISTKSGCWEKGYGCGKGITSEWDFGRGPILGDFHWESWHRVGIRCKVWYWWQFDGNQNLPSHKSIYILIPFQTPRSVLLTLPHVLPFLQKPRHHYLAMPRLENPAGTMRMSRRGKGWTPRMAWAAARQRGNRLSTPICKKVTNYFFCSCFL